MTRLTPRQSEALRLIREALLTQGRAPTRRELARALGLRSACSAQRHIEALVRKGFLVRTGYAYRGLTLAGAAAPPFALLLAVATASRRLLAVPRDHPDRPAAVAAWRAAVAALPPDWPPTVEP